jgi:hypothetical protein
MMGIWLRADYQSERRLSQVSNGSFKNLNRSTGWELWFLEDDGAAENFISVQIAASKEKSILWLFGWDSSPEMNTKNLGNSPVLPSVTYSASSDKRFRSYGILKINFAAEFYFWTEQRLNGTQLLGLGLAETSKVLNTIMVRNPLSFLMVHNMDPYS